MQTTSRMLAHDGNRYASLAEEEEEEDGHDTEKRLSQLQQSLELMQKRERELLDREIARLRASEDVSIASHLQLWRFKAAIVFLFFLCLILKSSFFINNSGLIWGKAVYL